MPYKDPQRQKEYLKAWEKSHPERARRKKRPEKARAASKKWRLTHVEHQRRYQAQWNARNSEYIATWRATNKDRRKKSGAAWNAAHRQEVRESAAAWRKANPDRTRAYSRAWTKAHPDLKRQQRDRSRARKNNAQGYHTAAEMESLFKQQMELCANPHCCVHLTRLYGFPNSRERDHIYPLHISPGVPQGTNYIENMWWLCRACNARKHSMNPIDWALQRGFLLPNNGPKMYAKRGSAAHPSKGAL